jgi:predicted alpha/beta hydrolase
MASNQIPTTPAEVAAWVSLPDGARTEVTTFACTDAAAPAVMILPAMGVPARFYARLASALASAGCHAVLHDLRGQGKSDRRAGRHVDWSYETLVLEDLPAVIAHVQRALPGAPIVFLGHSLGGHLALMYLGWTPDSPVLGVALVASGNPHGATFAPKQRLRLLLAGALASPLARLVGHFPGNRLGFGGRQARRLIDQWALLAREGRFDVRGPGGLDAERAMRRVERPILAITIEGDDMAPPASTESLLGKVPRATVECWHYEPGAGSPEADHFRWAKDSPRIVARVASFARDLSASP